MSNKSSDTDTDNLLNRQHMCSDPVSFKLDIFIQERREKDLFDRREVVFEKVEVHDFCLILSLTFSV